MVLTTLASIFLLFRTCEFIVKYNRIGHRGPFSSVKYTIFIKFIKKYVKILLFEVSFFPTFFGAILGPIWLPFSGAKIHIFFFQKLAKTNDTKIQPPPFIRHFLPNALRTPKMCPKGPQNVPKMLPKMLPKRLPTAFKMLPNMCSRDFQKSYLLVLLSAFQEVISVCFLAYDDLSLLHRWNVCEAFAKDTFYVALPLYCSLFS